MYASRSKPFAEKKDKERDEEPLSKDVLVELGRGCLEAFVNLAWAVKKNITEIQMDLSQTDVENLINKYSIWLSDAGLGEDDLVVLSTKLRDYPDIYENIAHILKDIGSDLQMLSSMINGLQEQRIVDNDNDPFELSDDSEDDEDARLQAGKFNAPKNGQGFRLTEDAPRTEIDVLFATVSEEVRGLYDISKLMKGAKLSHPFSTFTPNAEEASKYKEAARIRHPKLSPWLAVRLGKAQSLRAQYLSTRESHMSDFQAHTNTLRPGSGKSSPTQTEFDLLGTHDYSGDSGSPASGYLTSSSVSQNTSRVQSLPNPPARYGDPCECPYCKRIITINNRSEWERHFSRDIRPYVCTFESCAGPTFASIEEWFQHEQAEHRRTRMCIFCPDEQLFDSASLLEHLLRAHIDEFGERQIAETLAACPTFTPRMRADCPFCSEWQASAANDDGLVNAGRYKRHVGRHLLELAVALLPGHTAAGRRASIAATDGASDAHKRTLSPNYKPPTVRRASDVNTRSTLVLRPKARLDPSFPRLLRKDVDRETLVFYDLPWEVDEDDDDFVIVKQEMSQRDIQLLFAKTQQLRRTQGAALKRDLSLSSQSRESSQSLSDRERRGTGSEDERRPPLGHRPRLQLENRPDRENTLEHFLGPKVKDRRHRFADSESSGAEAQHSSASSGKVKRKA